MAIVQIQGISKRYGGKDSVYALQPCDLEIHDGEFITILGPSGSGKTTLLSVIVGVVAPTAGRVLIDGVDITYADPRERDMAMVFQNFALYPSKTVRANLAFPLRMQGVSRAERTARVEATVETLGLSPYINRYPRELSGGQQQRVALGRALIRQPKLFLMDEPLSNLDAKLRMQMRSEIKRLHREYPVTTVYVTHDQSEAMALSDRVMVMNNGVVAQVDTPANVYAHPADQFVAGFVGAPAMNFIPVSLESSGAGVNCRGPAGQILVQVDRQATGQEHVVGAQLGVRPAHLQWMPASEVASGGGNWLGAKVKEVDSLGDEDTVIYARMGEVELTIVERDGRKPRVDDDIAICIRPEAVHLFGNDGRALGGRAARARDHDDAQKEKA